MLLRVIETGETQQIGAQKGRKADVRVVAATDADLEAGILRGTFRAPLLHRLAGCEIRLPPLRERREDVPRLLLRFLEEELRAIGEADRLTAAPSDAPGCPRPSWRSAPRAI
jgi:two-component system, NtrC family, nitrogen regulation response regulator GlnG